MNSPVATRADASDAAPSGRPPRRPWDRAAGWLTRLADSPVNLWLALLAANAVFLPYRSRWHDAILYGFQVQNAAEQGRFHDDLFLRYGSQDNYSLFSLAAAPLARAIGLQPALFLLYLLSTALFFLAAVRLVRRLIPGRFDAALGLVLLAVSQPYVGGMPAIRLNEDFLTARLPAEVLVLFGLERLVAGHPVAALLLQLAALTIHPLMAFGGLLACLVWCALRHVHRQYLAPLAVVGLVLALAAWLIGRSVGVGLLAPIDAFWLAEVSQCSTWMFINNWTVDGWVTLFVAVLVVAWARWRLSLDSAATRLLTAVLAVTALALAGSVVVYYAPFPLILQGQPLRALWLVKVLAVPLALPVARNLWSRGDGPWRAAAVLLLWSLGTRLLSSAEVGLTLVFPVGALLLRGAARVPRTRGWLWLSLAISLGSSTILEMGLDLTTLCRVDLALSRLVDPSVRTWLAVVVVPPAVRMLLSLAILAILGLLTWSRPTFRFAALALFLASQVGWYRLQDPGPSGTQARVDGPAIRFVRTFLTAQGPTGGRPPTVYWPAGQVDMLWHDLEVNSYYAWFQLAGNVFRRETAVEGRRRGELVRTFEVDMTRRRRLMEPLGVPTRTERTFGIGLKDDPPRLADLLRLCADEGLDYAVLRQGFPGWYAAHEGEWFVYDGRAVRDRVRSEGRATGVSMMRPAAIR